MVQWVKTFEKTWVQISRTYIKRTLVGIRVVYCNPSVIGSGGTAIDRWLPGLAAYLVQWETVSKENESAIDMGKHSVSTSGLYMHTEIYTDIP